MRILIAQFNHETNTFSPLPTPLAAFRPLYGAAALQAVIGKQTPIGAFYDWATQRGDQLICPILAHAWPSGPVDDAAFDHICDTILASLDDSIDLVLLDLHGAMVCKSHQDGEGELLARLRAKRPEVVIGVALDLHGHVTRQMVALADAITGYQTYPHIDMYDTGTRLCRVIEAMLDQGLRPKMQLLALPMLAHTLPMNTTRPGAMRDMVDLAASLGQAPGMLDLSLFGGFPAADITEAGMAVLGLSLPEHDLNATMTQMAAALWARRAEFIYDQRPLAQSLAQARAAADAPGSGPILLLDHGDNCMSGGTCDNMDVLEAALAMGLNGLLTGPIRDPEAAAAAFAAGIGAEISLAIGNKTPAENFAPPAPPLALKARVTALSDGRYQISGPIYNGMICDMGRTAVIEAPAATLVISETTHEPWDLGVFTSLGLDPLTARYLLLKSRMYCRPVFEPHAKAVVECAGGGVTGSDFSLFNFQNLRRPIYPLDANANWTPHNEAAAF